MNVLVTGGAGFIGSHLVDALVYGGHRVRVLDDFATSRRGNLSQVAEEIDVVEGSVLDPEGVRRAMAGVEVVFHEAAIPSVPRSVRHPLLCHEVNVTGTLNVLIAARDTAVRRVIYAASSSAYGAAPGEARVETMPTRPVSPYAVAKLAGEQYCQAFTGVYGLETVCLRYFNVFGPRQDPTSEYAAVIPRFISCLREGRPLPIFGDGSQSRDFTFVANVVSANLLAMSAPAASGEVFNIGCGREISLCELVRQLGQIAGIEPNIEYREPRSGDVLRSLADISMAQALLGYEPVVSFRMGLKRTWEWFEGPSTLSGPGAGGFRSSELTLSRR